MKIDADVSRNFETAKVVAILVVACGHFLPPSSFWVVVSVALCLFSFNSGYFTAVIYGDKPDSIRFVRNKLTRLGPDMIAINLLLVALFLVARQGEHRQLAIATRCIGAHRLAQLAAFA